MKWWLLQIGKWVVYVCVLGLTANALSWAGTQLNLSSANEASIFTRLSIVLTVFSGLALWVIRGWAEISISGGVRPVDISKLRGQVRSRKMRMYNCLGIGVASGIVLQIPAAILESATGITATILSTIGYFCLLNMGVCLVVALYDWHEQQETVAALIDRARIDERRRAELEKLGSDDDEQVKG